MIITFHTNVVDAIEQLHSSLSVIYCFSSLMVQGLSRITRKSRGHRNARPTCKCHTFTTTSSQMQIIYIEVFVNPSVLYVRLGAWMH